MPLPWVRSKELAAQGLEIDLAAARVALGKNPAAHLALPAAVLACSCVVARIEPMWWPNAARAFVHVDHEGVGAHDSRSAACNKHSWDSQDR